MPRSHIVIVTPALAQANNGNWQTAQRWARFLAQDYPVRVVDTWNCEHPDDALMIALHARRSAPSVAAWRQAHPHRPLLLVLTGTDLYRDILQDATAQHSLQLADKLVVLNEMGLAQLPPALRHKGVVCLQSAPARATQPKTSRHLRALMVGHLREEKSPQTYFDAARLLTPRPDILLDHIGDALDPTLGALARSVAADCPAYRWLGAQPHAATRRRIQAAHVLVHASKMEGGAHAVIEALVSGTPVIASRIDGNVGLLGAHYSGYFEWGNAPALTTLLTRLRDDVVMLEALQAQCAQRAALFHPRLERQTLLNLVAALFAAAVDTHHERTR
jgi:putative glycosyltransferase (TIGR04348 family)